MLTIFAFTIQSCSKDDEPTVVAEEPVVVPPVVVPVDQTVTGTLTANTTWTADRIWIIDKKVVVGEGITLTIEAGTIIKGTLGAGANCSALIIARGGKINAVGTAAKPIIFTTVGDNIKLGEKAGTNLTGTDNSLWGGLIILGKAKCSLAGDVEALQIEGIPATDAYGLYGGTNNADNSGTLSYVSIRHCGAEIGAGNEINGLTLGGVGSGTTINNIEVFATFDDGIEYFGGSVNTTNVLVYAFGDDGLDIDQSYSGTISNGMVIKAATGDSGLEIDGPEGSYNASFTLDKITLIGNSANVNRIGDFRAGARGTSKNVYVVDYPSTTKVRMNDALSSQNFANDILVFQAWNIKAAATTGIFTDAASGSTFPAAIFATAVTSPATGVGADASAFSWTLAKAKNLF